MPFTERRPHWKIGQTEPDRDEHGVSQPDPDAKRWACFTLSRDAADWLLDEVLAKRTVEDLGGFDEAHQWHEWIIRQGTRDDETDPVHVHATGEFTVTSFTIGDVDYRMETCTCTDEVTGRCHNLGCDRDADYDSEPDGGRYPGYTKWGNHCWRCWYPEHANGGFTTHSKPVPEHRHRPEQSARVARLIEDDEWVGWVCRDVVADDGTECGYRWRFTDAEEWASQFRLTRMWNGKVTGTEGYTITEEEAIAEVARRNALSVENNSGFTVGYEPAPDNEKETSQ